jgi:hypothetical protein
LEKIFECRVLVSIAVGIWIEFQQQLTLNYLKLTLGMGFSYNPDTGAMTTFMKHSVIEILEKFLTSDLLVQSTPYSMDLFDTSTDPTLVDQLSYLRLVGMTIWLLKLRFEIQLAVIMACPQR